MRRFTRPGEAFWLSVERSRVRAVVSTVPYGRLQWAAFWGPGRLPHESETLRLVQRGIIWVVGLYLGRSRRVPRRVELLTSRGDLGGGEGFSRSFRLRAEDYLPRVWLLWVVPVVRLEIPARLSDAISRRVWAVGALLRGGFLSPPDRLAQAFLTAPRRLAWEWVVFRKCLFKGYEERTARGAERTPSSGGHG